MEVLHNNKLWGGQVKMLYLDTTTKYIAITTTLVTGSDCVATWEDITNTTFTPGSNEISVTNTLKTLIDSPGAGVQRRIKSINIRPTTGSPGVTITHRNGVNTLILFQATVSGILQWLPTTGWLIFS
jgi:hypothetical protein